MRFLCQVSRKQNAFRAQWVKIVFDLLNSPSPTVAYEAGNTLLAMTNLDTAVAQSVKTLIRLLQASADNNVKLIILNRLTKLKKRNEKTLQVGQ